MSDEVQTEARETVTQALILKSRAVTVVTNDEDFNAVESQMKSLKDTAKANLAHIGPWADHIKDLNAKRLALEKKLIKEPESEAKRLKGLCGQYTLEQQREADRVAREAARKAQEAAESERLALAESLERSGNSEQAEAILDIPVMPAPAPVLPEVKKAENVRRQWKARIVDPKAFFGAVAEGKVIIPDLSEAHLEQLKAMFRLQKLADALGAEMKVPGVEVEERLV